MKTNWYNRIENVVLIALTLIAVRIIMIQPLEKQLERQNQTIEKLAEREKYSYQILNKFEERIKSKDGQLVIDLNNTMHNQHLGNLPVRDSITTQEPVKKQGFLKRLFNSKSKKK